MRGVPAVRALVALALVVVAAQLALGDEEASGPGEVIEPAPAPAANPPAPANEGEDAAAEPPPAPSPTAVRKALRRAVADAAALGGAVEAAALHESWRAPVAAAAGGGAPDRQMRMWSTSKAVTLVALLREHGWGEKPGEPLSAETQTAVNGAITRSENCRQRRVLVELQELAGGPDGARRALEEVLAMAGARAQIAREAQAPEELCAAYLGAQREPGDPMAPALPLGTSTWSVLDAARFMDALGAGVYGDAVRDEVLRVLRAPKRLTRETAPSGYTAALDWGAGRALGFARPAYKAGWGGALLGEFVAEQMALADLPGVGRVAVAIAFHPDSQPLRDDPGLTAAPRAIELVMEALAQELRASSRG